MSLQTSTNAVTAKQESTMAGLLAPQMQSGSIGKIAESVNAFRGEVLLPIDLVSLRGRGGLEAKVVLTYCSSGVSDQASTWNVSAPTSVVGLGWSLPFELILLENESMSPYDAVYYLASNDGSRNRLYLVEQTPELWRFEARAYDFAEICYLPQTNSWRIRTSEGLVKEYGTDSASRYQAVKWGGENGNWVGSGTQAGQTPFVRAWNLAALRNPWGDSIQFEYESELSTIGGARGLPYTRACYLRAITDSSGRAIRFNYEQKIYADQIKEYERPHQNPAARGPEAYQDRFETRFLSSIDVAGPGSSGQERLFTVHLSYSVDLLSQGSGDAAYLYKRYLRAISVAHANGAIEPGMLLGYYGDHESERNAEQPCGVLKSVTYPDGGQVTYTLAKRPLAGTSLDLRLTRDATGGGVPRLWFGDNYVVLTRYDVTRARTLTVNVYDWNGSWIGSQPLVTPLSGDLVPGSLEVLPTGEGLVLTLRTRGASHGDQISTYAFTRRFGRFGEWDVAALEMPKLENQDASAEVVAGESFIAAAATNVRTLYRFAWDPRQRSWVPQHLALDVAGEFTLGVYGNYVSLCAYDPRAQAALLTIHHLDPERLVWQDQRLDTLAPILWDAKLPKLSWSNAASIATATYLTGSDPSTRTLSYATRTYLWDRNFDNVRIERRDHAAVPEDTPEPFFLSRTAGSLVGNIGNLLRYDGNTWAGGYFGPFDQGKDITRFAYGDDIAIGTMQAKSRVMSYDPYTNRFLPMFEIQGSSGPAQPTISDRCVTVRGRVYYRSPTGTLAPIGSLVEGTTDVANHGPNYLAFGAQGGAAYFWSLKNGKLAATAQKLSGRLFPEKSDEPGTRLTGAAAFATYTGPSFDAAEQITLHRLVQGEFAGPIHTFAVTRLTVDDGLGNVVHNCYEPCGDATLGPYDLTAQFTRVKIVLGSDDPASAPHGYTIKTFFNGLAPAGKADDVPYALLNGQLASKQSLDSTGRLLREERHAFEAVRQVANARDRAPRALAGAYVRESRAEQAVYDPDAPRVPPLTTTYEYEYDEANGRPRRVRTYNFNSDQRVEVLDTEASYAYERYPELVGLNLLAPVALRTQRVDGAIVRIDATTWKKDWGTAGSVWAVHRELRAKSAGAVLRETDWSGQTRPDRALWRLDREYEERDPHGNSIEGCAADGVPQATLFDAAGLAPVATFRNARLSAGQCTYLGFERYESASVWSLGGSVEALWAAVVRGDSHTGSRSLRLAGANGGTAGPGLAAKLDLRDAQARTYLLSCWVKTLSGYTGAPGAAWSVRWGGASRAEWRVPNTGGEWQQIHGLVDLPAAAEPSALELALVNADPGALLVDDVRFGPAVGECSVDVYDALRLPRRVAAIESSGATRRWIYAQSDAPVAAVEPGEATTQLTQEGWSRAGNGGTFDAGAPNGTVSVRPQRQGESQRFDATGSWWKQWRGDGARWHAQDFVLRHQPGQADRLAFAGFSSSSERYGLSLCLRAGAPLSAPLGVQIGEGLQIVWVPERAAFQVDDLAAGKSRALPPRARAYLDYARHAPALDAGEVSALRPSFSRSGLPLTSGAEIQVVTKGASWIVADPATVLTYYLVRAPEAAADRIAVVTLPQQWLLLVAAGSAVLFADGLRVVCQPLSRAPAGELAIVATDAIEIDHVAAFDGAECQVSYRNGAGQIVQEQALEEGGAVAMQTIVDAVARPALTSMAARLEAGEALFAYEPGLATFDWTTLVLGGLVAQQNADAGFAAYARARFEPSPLGRQIETGLPGAAFAIAPSGSSHTFSTRHGLNDAGSGLAEGKYFRRTELDPEGGEQSRLTDGRGLVVRSSTRIGDSPASHAVTAYRYDAAGNLVEVLTPAGARSQFGYDFLGQRVESRPAGEGVSRYLYDRAGRLRFQMDANGAASHPRYVRYFKYDVLSRLVEEGCFAHDWDDELAAQVDAPAWPSATASQIYEYDGLDRGDLRCLGQLVATTNRRQADEAAPSEDFAIVERFDYDVRGRKTSCALRAEGFRATDYVLRYTYDNLGQTASIVYPDPEGGRGLEVAYERDAVGRTRAVRVDGELLADYAYDANGRVQGQGLYHQGQRVAERSMRYNAPGWLTNVSDPFFSEQIDYTSGRYPDGGGYYNGNPAQTSAVARGGQPAVVRSYQFDVAGRLCASAGGDAEPVQYRYDSDGNALQLGGARLSYDARDRLVRRTAGGDTYVYTYDENGNETRVEREGGGYERTLEFDAFRGLPLRASLSVNGAAEAQVSLRYGYQRRRAYKAVVTPEGEARTLYVRAIGSAQALVEVGSPNAPSVEYIHGPDGLLALRVGGALHFVSRDRLGSIRAVFDPRGQLVAGYDYQPFGAALRPPFGSQPNISRYRFAERELEPVGLYDFRARLYDPETGRFVSPDPAAQFASPYVYAGNNPTWNRDETGEIFGIDDLLIAVAIGALIGAVAGGVSGAVAIGTQHLSGGKAAGVFFASMGIGAGVGALGGALGYAAGLAADAAAAAVAPALGEAGAVAGTTTGAQIAAGAATRVGVGIVLGAANGAITGGTYGAIGQAMNGGDWREGFGQGALTGALGGAVGELAGSIGKLQFYRTAWQSAGRGLAVNAPAGTERFAVGVLKNTPLNSALGFLGGAAGGAAGGALQAKLKGDTGSTALMDILAGAGYGALSGALGQVRDLTRYYRAGGAGRAAAPAAPARGPDPMMVELQQALPPRV